MPSYAAKWPVYAKQWNSMSIRPSKVNAFTSIAKRLIASKDRYVAAEKLTGVPWYMIAVIHERESSQNWNTQLAQGDPLSRKSTHVPRGRGPFTGPDAWSKGAYDALVTLKSFNKIIDWRLEKILFYLELYNGWGYSNKGVPSAYLWAGSTVYTSGKYVSDGVWSSSAVDTQAGAASLLFVMMQIDSSIRPKRESNLPEKKDVTGAVAVAAGTGVLAWMGNHEMAIALGSAGLFGLGVYLYYKFKHRNDVHVDVVKDQPK